jgi:hypothetical protein
MRQDSTARHVSLVVPILLIVFGSLFLYSNWHPAFQPWPVVLTYWPALLVLVGIGMFWDTLRQRSSPGSGSTFPLGSTIGVILFAILLVALIRHRPQFASMRPNSDSLSHTSQTLDRQGAKTLHANLKLGAGQITLRGGATHLFEGNFEFGPAYEKPHIDYQVSGGAGELEVTQHQIATTFGDSGNDWSLRFADDMPLDLNIDLGAGKEDLQFRNMALRKLELNVGAGRVDVDLTGDRKNDLDAEIKGGVGEANVRLPKNVGVSVRASGGIGSIDTDDLKKEDGEYVNEAYGKSPASIRLTVQGGIGAIHLIQER